MQRTLKVEGMSCSHCAGSIEGALKAIGVRSKVDLASHTVLVEYDADKLPLESVKEAIEEQGYAVV